MNHCLELTFPELHSIFIECPKCRTTVGIDVTTIGEDFRGHLPEECPRCNESLKSATDAFRHFLRAYNAARASTCEITFRFHLPSTQSETFPRVGARD
jgi:uncharacterized C2H2 Zn-finger protein